MSIAPVVSNSLLERFSRKWGQTIALSFSAALLSILPACGSSSPAPPTPQVAVQIAPPSGGLAIFATAKAQFSATVTGSTNPIVNWSVTEAGGGTIDATGMYTAPAAAGTFHVVAMAQADTTKTASLAATVTVGKPTFSSTPPTEALEGRTYSYTLAANDPAGAGVIFTLQGPDGAVVSGTSLSWTPAPAQARMTNTFTVTATTAAGGVETQTWSLTPNGTVRISDFDKYWSVNAEGELETTSHPNDLSDSSTYDIAALVPQADGSVLAIQGVGKPDGTATIAGVPGGQYWLQIRPAELYWTSTSAFDYGSDFVGRVPSAAISATLAWASATFRPGTRASIRCCWRFPTPE